MKLYHLFISILLIAFLSTILFAGETLSTSDNDDDITTPITIPDEPAEPSEPPAEEAPPSEQPTPPAEEQPPADEPHEPVTDDETTDDETTPKTDDELDEPITDELPEDYLQMEKVSIPSFLDSQSKAFSIVIPSNWDYSGKVIGDSHDIDFHAVSLKANHAKKPLAVEIFPATVFNWSDEPSFQPEPLEAEIFAQAVLPTISAKYYIESILIPLYRSDYSDLRIIETVDLPSFGKEMEKADPKEDIPDGSILTYDAATSVVEYYDNGELATEELFVVIRRIDSPKQTIDGVFTSSEYQIDFQIAVKSPRDYMEDYRTLLTGILRSLSFDEIWYEFESNDIYPYRLKKEGYYLISRIFNRNAMNMIAWYDPVTRRSIEFPPQYKSVWCNDDNEYVLCPTEECDPTLISRTKWYAMDLF